ncbi:phosphoribosylamine--glycine ligase [Candidatus Latescibacterota bacterium]
MMKVLVVGGGGREHAIAWKLSQSKVVKKMYAAPGNAGISSLATCVDISADDVTAIAKFAVSEKIDLVAVGPETPLCMGIIDLLDEADIPAFGPSAKAAMIEGSKIFSKRIMRKYRIPTAEFDDFDDFDNAVSYARSLDSKMWIKASGLAAGKGAVFASDPGEAEKILRKMMIENEFGESGQSVVIEENLEGEEASIFALCDGSSYKLLVPSQDHKRAYDGDTGPNTGGMGAYAPAPLITASIMSTVEKKIIQPTLDGMASEGIPYKGLLYAGIIITEKGPKVIEYNCRFGDPETQAVLPLLDGDLAEIMLACVNENLSKTYVRSSNSFALCLVVASGGYPDSYEKGKKISGINEADSIEGVKVFHAGTKFEIEDILSNGGRVLGVTGWGADFAEARKRAYEAAGKIHFEGSFYRKDIGNKALKYLITND